MLPCDIRLLCELLTCIICVTDRSDIQSPKRPRMMEVRKTMTLVYISADWHLSSSSAVDSTPLASSQSVPLILLLPDDESATVRLVRRREERV